MDLVQKTIQTSFGKIYTVEVFGSARYGVSFSDSDLDLVVLDPERVSGFEVKECITLPSPSIYYLRRLRRALEKAGFTKIESVARAAVPIVKFKDPRTGLECDLNVNERLGLVNSDLLKTYCDISPLLRPMLFKIKEWAKPLGLNRPSSPPGEPASFSSYALALMTIAFLQSRELLPNLQANLPPLDPAVPGSAVWTRRGEKCDVRYHHNVNNWQPKTDPLLEEVMTDWFSYWHRGFNYAEQEISIRDGGLRTKLSPKESSEPGWMPNGINVFDPFIVSKNVTRAVGRNVLERFITECGKACGQPNVLPLFPLQLNLEPRSAPPIMFKVDLPLLEFLGSRNVVEYTVSSVRRKC